MRTTAVCLTLALALSACATPYQSAGFSGGFTESWRSKYFVVVEFKGNGFTSPEAASEMAILRAAELALAHNFGYFQILGDADASTTVFVPGTTTTTGRLNPDGTFTARSRDNSFTAVKPGSKIYVGMVAITDPSDPSVYDAKEVVARLGPKYR